MLEINDDAINTAYENLANAVVVRAAEDIREAISGLPKAEAEYTKMVKKNDPKLGAKIKRKERTISKLEEQLAGAKRFLLSDYLTVFTQVDGTAILKGLEAEA